MKHIIFASLVLAASTSTVLADAPKCVLKVTRTACPGKEKESFSKCAGKASCDVEDAAADEKACAEAALKACENTADRQQTTKSKTVTALFGGKVVQAGKNFCEATRPDFNKCK